MGNKYKTLSKRYLTSAKKLMLRGDYLQAGEKLWGAAAQMVKAYAEERDQSHNGHKKLFQIVRRMANRTGDVEIPLLFDAANVLHMNFYENWLGEEEVKERARQVEKLIQKIEQLLKGKKK